MKRAVTILVLLSLSPAVGLSQDIDFDGRHGGTKIEFPRYERPSSSASENRRRADTETYDLTVPAPPNPLPGFVNDYQALRNWFTPNFFPDAPALVAPTNLSELYRALNYLKDYADNRLRGLRERKAVLQSRVQGLEGDIRWNNDVSSSLSLEVSSIESDLQRTSLETRTNEEKLAQQTTLLDQLQTLSKRLADDVVATKNDLFKELYDAANAGRLLPPSNYRSAPKPLNPVYGPPSAQAEMTPVYPTFPMLAPAPAAAEALRPMANLAALSAQPIRRTPVSEAEIQEKMNGVRQSLPLLNQSINDVIQLNSRISSLEQSANSSGDSVRQLKSRVESLRLDNATAAAALNSVKSKLADASEAYQRQREKLPVQCLEYAITKYYSKRVKEFVEQSFPDVKEVAPAVNREALGSFVKVMSHVVELGSDTLKIIDRVPGALVYDVEDPSALQTELDAVVEKFKVNFIADMTGWPKFVIKNSVSRKAP